MNLFKIRFDQFNSNITSNIWKNERAVWLFILNTFMCAGSQQEVEILDSHALSLAGEGRA